MEGQRTLVERKLQELYGGLQKAHEDDGKTKKKKGSSSTGSKSIIMLRKMPHILKLTQPESSFYLYPSADQLRHSALALVSKEQLQQLYFTELLRSIRNRDEEQPSVKLIVTSVTSEKSKNRVLSQFKDWGARVMNMRLGALHTALQVGPLILEWNNSSLIVPVDSSSYFHRKALCSIDLEFTGNERLTEEGVRAVCEMIADWNANRRYSVQHNNCQVFTDALFERVGLQRISGEVRQFMKKLFEMDLERDLQFQHTFENGEKVEFKSHGQLDLECINRDLKEGSLDYKLCKAYDRMFWLRYYGVKSSISLVPHEKEMLLTNYKEHYAGCPFKNPADTKTMYGRDDIKELGKL